MSVVSTRICGDFIFGYMMWHCKMYLYDKQCLKLCNYQRSAFIITSLSLTNGTKKKKKKKTISIRRRKFAICNFFDRFWCFYIIVMRNVSQNTIPEQSHTIDIKDLEMLRNKHEVDGLS